jgi:chorismate-pyruvate lyase
MDERSRSGLAARAWMLLSAALLLSACAAAPTRAEHERLLRTQVLALLQGLNADLLGHDSATLTLERWCAAHRLAEPARIVAQRVHGEEKPLPAALRERLGVGEAEPIAYRRVRLTCGAHGLSEADNWYVPARLTTEMNRRLDTSDEPFGKVVRALGFRRRTLAAQLLWSPLPAGWEMAPQADPDTAPLRIPHALLRHEAVLYDAAGRPFSAVVETYTNQVLDFGPWAERLAAADR